MLLGFIALYDKVRNKVGEAVNIAKNTAKLNVVLVSGDHVKTAESVAK